MTCDRNRFSGLHVGVRLQRLAWHLGDHLCHRRSAHAHQERLTRERPRSDVAAATSRRSRPACPALPAPDTVKRPTPLHPDRRREILCRSAGTIAGSTLSTGASCQPRRALEDRFTGPDGQTIYPCFREGPSSTGDARQAAPSELSGTRTSVTGFGASVSSCMFIRTR